MKSFLRIGVSILLAAYAICAWSQNSPPRRGKTEFTLSPQFTGATTWNGDQGSQAHLDGALGFGFGIAYNLDNHLSLGGEFMWGSGDYRATITPAAGNNGSSFDARGTLYTSTIRMNATWNFLASDLTPFVMGGIGSTYVNTNIPDGPPVNACWWDPYWGNYCGYVQPTKTSTDLSYLAAAGLRWDANRDFFMRAFYARQWIDHGGSIGVPFVNQYRIDFGFKF